MVLPNPEWLVAGAEAAIAAETGVIMFKSKAKDPAPTPAPVGAAAVRTVSFDAVLVFAGLVLLGMMMLGAAMIIHHGLVS